MYKLYMYCIATTYCTVCFDMYAIFEANRRKIFLLQVKRNLSYYTMLIYLRFFHSKSREIGGESADPCRPVDGVTRSAEIPQIAQITKKFSSIKN